MKDAKLQSSIFGLGRADCIISISKTDCWASPTNIRNEFPIERNAVETLTLYQQLIDDDVTLVLGKGF